MPRPSRRDDIIKTAVGLFGKHGFHGTGVDMIMREAKVSKKTMYNYFRSKDEIILATLQYYDGLFRNNFMKQVNKSASTPEKKLLGLFDVAKDWFMQDNFFGCMFINAVGEYSDANTPIHNICLNFKTQIHDFIKELAIKTHTDNPDGLADELALLLEGAIVTAQVGKNPAAADIAKTSAQRIIKDHLF
jgi:AcrR family transcriptional regulator